MKKNLILNIALASTMLSFAGSTQAVTATPTKVTPTSKVATTTTPAASPSAMVDKAVEQLKEKVANKVSELKKKNQKAVAGAVTKVSGATVTMLSNDGTTYTVKIDDTLTEFYQVAGTQLKDLKKDSIAEDDYIIVTGLITDKSIDANAIYVDEQFLVKSGKITAVDKTDFSLSIMTNDKENYTIDIQSKTQQQILNIKTLEVERTGFSKLKEGDTVHFIVKKNAEDPKATRFDGIKILVVPQEYFLK